MRQEKKYSIVLPISSHENCDKDRSMLMNFIQQATLHIVFMFTLVVLYFPCQLVSERQLNALDVPSRHYRVRIRLSVALSICTTLAVPKFSPASNLTEKREK